MSPTLRASTQRYLLRDLLVVRCQQASEKIHDYVGLKARSVVRRAKNTVLILTAMLGTVLCRPIDQPPSPPLQVSSLRNVKVNYILTKACRRSAEGTAASDDMIWLVCLPSTAGKGAREKLGAERQAQFWASAAPCVYPGSKKCSKLSGFA